MLLTDVLKFTPSDHVEYESIKESLRIMEEIALSINESKKVFDNESAMKELIQNLKGKYNISSEIDRQLIRDYNIKLMFPSLKIINEEYKLLCFNDILALYDTKKKKNHIFFIVFIKLKEKLNDELHFDIIYNNNKEKIIFQFKIISDIPDFLDTFNNLSEKQNLNLLNNGN
jgi:hypothetical protein